MAILCSFHRIRRANVAAHRMDCHAFVWRRGMESNDMWLAGGDGAGSGWIVARIPPDGPEGTLVPRFGGRVA
jgi:hypothetical protein